MKIIKYPQSCLVVEAAGTRLLIDPGSLMRETYLANDLWPLDAILLTHEHEDHADPQTLRAIAVAARVPVFGNESTKRLLGELVTYVVTDAQSFMIKNITVTTHELPHVPMINGELGPQNTGYIIDNNFLHPGDSITAKDLKIRLAAAPLAGPDISPRDVFDFIKQLQCQTVVPVHYDIFPANPKMFADIAKRITPDVKFVTLANGESAEL